MKSRTYLLRQGLLVILLLGCFAGCGYLMIQQAPTMVLELAQKNLSQNNYEEARRLADSLTQTEETKQILEQCDRLELAALLQDEQYGQALAFYDARGWEHTVEYQQIAYRYACKTMKEDLPRAIALFEPLLDYRDSRELQRDCQYRYGVQLMAQGYYYSAQEMFLAVGDYRDATGLYRENCYQLALRLYQEERYFDSRRFFAEAGTVGDAKKYLEIVERLSHYDECLALAKKARYGEAIALAEQMPENYQDREQLLAVFRQAENLQLDGTWDSVRKNSLGEPLYQLEITSELQGLKLYYHCQVLKRGEVEAKARKGAAYKGVLQKDNTVLLSSKVYEDGVRRFQLRKEENKLYWEDVVELTTGETATNEKNLWEFVKGQEETLSD